MISEPELTDGSDDGRPVDLVGGLDGKSDGTFDRPFDENAGFDGVPLPAPRLRPPWVWVLGAVVVTSALWAGGTFVYDRGQSDRPSLHGYRMTNNPCAGFTLKPLTDAVGANDSEASPPLQHRGPVLDQTRCDFTAQAPYAQGGTTTYTVGVSVDLHKRVDPREEFDDQVRLEGGSLDPAEDIASVPGLGDEAYFLTRGDQGQELKVLHGGAVFTLDLTAYSDVNVSEDTLNGLDGGPYPLAPDLEQYQPALIQATRNIMKELQQR